VSAIRASTRSRHLSRVGIKTQENNLPPLFLYKFRSRIKFQNIYYIRKTIINKRGIDLKIRLLLLFLILAALVTTARISYSQIHPLEVTVKTDKPKYGYREMVTIYGNVTYNGENVEEGLTAIQVLTPSSETIVLRTLPSGSIPSSSWTVEVLSIVPCDLYGYPKDSFTRNSYAYFNLTVRNNGVTPKNALIALSVYDLDLTPLGFSFVILTLAPTTRYTSILSIYIYDWASTGTALACANAYTDWPQNKGYPYCPEKKANFNVTTTGSLSLTTTELNNTGNYQGNFRIPPEAQPYSNVKGTYFVAVAAFSKGWKAFNNVTFTVDYKYPEDFDSDGDIDIYDVVKVTFVYGSSGGHPGWNPQLDVQPNGKIDIYDVVKVTSLYGTKYQL